jgi:hypothetical protein
MNDRFYDEPIQNLISAQNYPGLEQLLCLAISDSSFAEQLLADPAQVVKQPPTSIQLSPIEQELVASITAANDIHDFAALLWAKVIDQKGSHEASSDYYEDDPTH